MREEERVAGFAIISDSEENPLATRRTQPLPGELIRLRCLIKVQICHHHEYCCWTATHFKHCVLPTRFLLRSPSSMGR